MRWIRSGRRVWVLGSVALALQALGGMAQAQEFKASGFLSLVAGRTQGDCVPTVLAPKYQSSCSRSIVDWGHAAVYDEDWALDQESRLGVQGEWKINREFTAVGQVTARTLKDQHLNLEWAYLSYTPSPEWKIQLGRKRIPLYYYSDFQDAGFAYNTVHPSPDVYGWDVVNYNGLSISNTKNLGDWTLRTEFYTGSEKSKKNPYYTLFTEDRKDVEWGGIAGLSLEASKDWFTGRVSYTRSSFQVRDRASGDYAQLYNGRTKANQSFLGLVLNGDWEEWQWRSEFGKARRMQAAGYDASFYLMNLGRQWGSFTLTAGMSRYAENSRFDLADYVPVKLSTHTVALRYDVHQGGALKVQLDRVRDRTAVAPLTGPARVFSVAYDRVF